MIGRFAIPLLLLAPLAAAQIYKVTDEHGNVVFTDRPASPDATTQVETIDLPETNRTPTVTPAPAAENTADAAPAAAVQAATVTIANPADETTIAMGPGNFSVSATTQPPLARNERLRLLIDGEPQGEPQRSGSWFIEGAMRGERKLRVLRVNSSGETVAESDEITIYVLRPSIISR